MIANIEPETSLGWTNGITQCCADCTAPYQEIWFTREIKYGLQTEGYGREFYRFGLELGGGLFLIKDINPVSRVA